jgi:hypothetical protein
MVDQTDIAKVVRLNEEYGNIVRAVTNLDGGAPILTVVVGAPENDQMQQAAVMQTHFMHFPPQMIDGIKSQARTRIDEIRHELAELGVTGLAEPEFRGARGVAPTSRTPMQPVAPAPRAPTQPGAPPRARAR